MSTIIETRNLGVIASRLLILAALPLAWFALMALAALMPGFAPTALAVVSDQSMLDRMPSDIRLVRGGRNLVVVTSSRPDQVAELYSAGAWLVFPSLANGCMDWR